MRADHDQRRNSKLNKMFELARQHHIVARENYWCCSSCGNAAIWPRAEELAKKGNPVRGVLFYHHQDYERAWVESGGRHRLSLRYSAFPESEDAAVWEGLGHLIVAIAEDAGFTKGEIHWDGNPAKTIELDVEEEDRQGFGYGKEAWFR